MGYRGKVAERERARELRADGWTYAEIVAELGVSRASVSLWVRDVPIDESVWAKRVRKNRRYGARNRSNRLAVARQAEIEQLQAEGRDRISRLTEGEFLVAGAALYAGEGSKTDGVVAFANNDPRMIAFFLAWLRHFFAIDECRLRVRLYLHDGLDLEAANDFWSKLTSVPLFQFGKPYRAAADPTIRKAKHVMGCPSVRYGCVKTHRAVMGLVHALLSCDDSIPG
ncbi:MAG: helix-turn-helix domain-containing protein [Acidimicrobiales bacterium]